MASPKHIYRKDAAKRLGISRQRIHQLIAQGALKAGPNLRCNLGTVTLHSVERLEAQRAEHKGGGHV